MPDFKKSAKHINKIESVANKKMKFCFSFVCLGVKIGVRTNNLTLNRNLLARLPEALPIERKQIAEEEVEHWFSIVKERDAGEQYKFYKEFELITKKKRLSEIINIFESQIRITIGEFAENFVFLHAGVVGWNGKAIVIPGKSFSGKSTLIAELVKRKCIYFSDEYAIIDESGLVHPFAKKLSLRGIIDDYQQVDFDVEQLGGRRASAPLHMGYLLITEYDKKVKNTKLKLERAGEGIMASVANSISVRRTPEFVLKVLSTFVSRAVVLKTKRGDAAEFADMLIAYLERKERSAATIKDNKKSGIIVPEI